MSVKTQKASPGLTVLASSAIFFLISLDTLITNVALPTIAQELGGSMTMQQWVVDGYTLAFASLLLFCGNLSDRFGAHLMFVAGTAAFGVSSVFCSFANSMEMLVAGRALLGVSAAMVLPPSMAVIREAYTDDTERARALGLWMSGGSVAAAAGPLAGGILTPIHWSLVFWVNVPVCLIVLVLARRIAASPTQVSPFDIPGQILATLGIVSLVGGIIEGGELGYTAQAILAAMAAGVVMLAAFVVRQGHAANPMMPLGLFKARGMRVALFCGFAFILSWFGTVFLVTQYLQNGLELTPFIAGLAFVPSSIGAFAGNVGAGRASARWGARPVMMFGLAIEAIALVLFAVLGPTLDLYSTMAVVCLAGLGGSVTMPPASGLVLSCATPEQSGIASAVFNTFRQVGASIGVAVFGSILAMSSSMGAGLSTSFAIAAVIVVCALVSVARLRN